jgi:hypothetical protein
MDGGAAAAGGGHHLEMVEGWLWYRARLVSPPPADIGDSSGIAESAGKIRCWNSLDAGMTQVLGTTNSRRSLGRLRRQEAVRLVREQASQFLHTIAQKIESADCMESALPHDGDVGRPLLGGGASCGS